jgi:hypothetical protein
MSFRSRRTVVINEPENESKLDLTNNVENPSNEDEEKQNDIKPVDVPPKSLYGNNLKKIKSFKKLRRGYKLQNQRAIFINDLKQLLRQFPAELHQYDDELLIEILNIAESFFIYGDAQEREAIKVQCIEELMKPYFKNDGELLLKTIGHVWQHVNKSNLRRRLWARFKKIFLPTK